MAWRSALCCIGALAAFGCAFAVAQIALAWRNRHQRAVLPQAAGVRDGRLAWLLRNGVAPVRPLAERIARLPFAQKLFADAAEVAAERGYVTPPGALVSVALLCVVALVLAVSLATSSVMCGCAVAACVVALGCAWVRSEQDKRQSAVREAVPDALRSMGVCFQGGYTLVQTLEQVADETKGPLHDAFSRAAHLLQTGGSTADALASLRARASVPELAFVSVALDVQHQAGGSMGHVLDSAREMVEEELDLARSLRVQTAQAKLSARVVSVMPFVLIAVFSLISEDFLSPFFSSAAGLCLLAFAVAMQAAGILAVRRMLKVEG